MTNQYQFNGSPQHHINNNNNNHVAVPNNNNNNNIINNVANNNDDSYEGLLSGVAHIANANLAPAFDDGGANATSYEGYQPNEPAPFNVASIQLPPPQTNCYSLPATARGQVQHRKGQETNETKTVEQTFQDVKTAERENAVHHQHVKNVLITVNRNHNHNVRLVTRDNNYHHHLINNVVRVNDIHNQRVEEVRGEGRTTRDFKQTSRVENGRCIRGTDAAPAPIAAPAPAPALIGAPAPAPAPVATCPYTQQQQTSYASASYAQQPAQQQYSYPQQQHQQQYSYPIPHQQQPVYGANISQPQYQQYGSGYAQQASAAYRRY